MFIDLPQLERELGVPVVSINPRKEKGIALLKKAIELTVSNQYKIPVRDFIENRELARAPIEDLQTVITSYQSFAGRFTRDWGLTSAAAIITILPVLIFFLLLQRRFIEGLTQGGLKA